jgi:hypothetical protein
VFSLGRYAQERAAKDSYLRAISGLKDEGLYWQAEEGWMARVDLAVRRLPVSLQPKKSVTLRHKACG